ncbi:MULTISPECIES: hypothetical protein [Bacillaceae]|uniref:hypothetical protein n=1 Tax=Bacillaceae TaxID=186817 RepID=UPI0004E247F1|nr:MULTISPECIES: hypothetical protein [Bacillaceae]MCF2649619.1 hypothetical protein [Niallia circulans]CAI9386737.1 hypothetical protein BACSP_01731 [Bacillus sp. T2.9-1]
MKSTNDKKREIQAKYRKLINKDNKEDNNDKVTEIIAAIFGVLFLIILLLNVFIKRVGQN